MSDKLYKVTLKSLTKGVDQSDCTYDFVYVRATDSCNACDKLFKNNISYSLGWAVYNIEQLLTENEEYLNTTYRLIV